MTDAPDLILLSDKELLALKRAYWDGNKENTIANRFGFFQILNEMTRRKKPHIAQPGYVYLMSDGKAHKIGVSINPVMRAKELLEDVEIICTIPTGNMKGFESSLHSTFIGQRIKRGNQLEWFALNPADVEYIKSLAVKS